MTHTLKSTTRTTTYTVLSATFVRISINCESGYIHPQTVTTHSARQHYRRTRDMIRGVYTAETTCG